MAFNHYPVILSKDWRNCKPGRMVYAESKGLWYIMSAGGFWNALPKKPDVIAMAELIGAIAKVTVKEIKDEISSDSFFENQRSRT
jgi:hypothetical protein